MDERKREREKGERWREEKRNLIGTALIPHQPRGNRGKVRRNLSKLDKGKKKVKLEFGPATNSSQSYFYLPLQRERANEVVELLHTKKALARKYCKRSLEEEPADANG